MEPAHRRSHAQQAEALWTATYEAADARDWAQAQRNYDKYLVHFDGYPCGYIDYALGARVAARLYLPCKHHNCEGLDGGLRMSESMDMCPTRFDPVYGYKCDTPAGDDVVPLFPNPFAGLVRDGTQYRALQDQQNAAFPDHAHTAMMAVHRYGELDRERFDAATKYVNKALQTTGDRYTDSRDFSVCVFARACLCTCTCTRTTARGCCFVPATCVPPHAGLAW